MPKYKLNFGTIIGECEQMQRIYRSIKQLAPRKINVLIIDRENDIVFLLYYFLDIYNKKCNKNINRVSPEVLNLLGKHSWPGNVREVKNFIELAVCTLEKESIQPEDLPILLKNNALKITSETSAKNEILTNNLDSLGDKLLVKMEMELIKKLLASNSENKTQTAKRLGISLNALKRKIRKYGIDGKIHSLF